MESRLIPSLPSAIRDIEAKILHVAVCPVCKQDYNFSDDDRSPVIAPCGHKSCTNCYK